MILKFYYETNYLLKTVNWRCEHIRVRYKSVASAIEAIHAVDRQIAKLSPLDIVKKTTNLYIDFKNGKELIQQGKQLW